MPIARRGVSLDMAHLAIGYVRTARLDAPGKSAVFHLHVNFEVGLFGLSTHVSRGLGLPGMLRAVSLHKASHLLVGDG